MAAFVTVSEYEKSVLTATDDAGPVFDSDRLADSDAGTIVAVTVCELFCWSASDVVAVTDAVVSSVRVPGGTAGGINITVTMALPP